MVPRESLVKLSSCEEATFITAEVPGLNGTAPEQPSIRVFSNESGGKTIRASHQVAKVLELQLQHQSFQ